VDGGLEHEVIYPATVMKNNDPQERIRLRVRCPEIYGQQLSGWVEPCVPFLPNYETPDVGDDVWITFIGGDTKNPVWLGRRLLRAFTGMAVESIVSSDTGVSGRLIVGEKDPVDAGLSPVDGDVWFDTFEFSVDWTNGWPSVTEVFVNSSANTYSRTTVQQTDDVHANAIARPTGRITAASGTFASDRRVLLFGGLPLLDDIAVTAMIFGRGPAISSAQQGIAMRVVNVGVGADQNMMAVWNDATLGGFPNLWNVEKWKGFTGAYPGSAGGPTDLSGGVSLFVESLEKSFHVPTASRATNVVTAVIDEPHDIRAGDLLAIKFADTTFNSGNPTVQTVTNQTITWNQTAANAGPTSGYVANFLPKNIYPHWIHTRCVGSMLEAKFWRKRDPRPSWSDPRAVLRVASVTDAPTGKGGVGLINAHQSFNASEFTDWGPIKVTRAYPGMKLRKNGLWVPVNTSTE
jgi:hypothetical protein